MRFDQTKYDLVFFVYSSIILSKKRGIVMTFKEQSGSRKAF
ncbi:hypothetical protein STRPO_1258 [Streptococcus porcinus str. Jelinkova 176]|uniref:Uncharacterized protein n=1 Tax=Streptococcus porcinus str. Jelinkova 176 TaxID=873448 RepID=A0ABN0CWN1_STRPO|nr:hypothetical protein STRPO_1258 [Streptococcus porcinus str. Jelinkova 176]